MNNMKNNIDKTYTDLLQDIMNNGVKKGDRTGTGTISVFGRQIRHKMSEGFPLLTTKKMAWKSMVVELIWFLRGDTNIKYLVDNGCNIWVGDAYKNYAEKQIKETRDQQIKMRKNGFDVTLEPIYLNKTEFIDKIKTDDEFAKKWGDLGPVYGKQWRDWGGYISKDHQTMRGESGIHVRGVDQIKNLIEELKTNPDSRRLMVNAWNVKEINNMVLPPCHYGFQVYTRELTWRERADIAKTILSKEEYDKFGYISPFIEPIIHHWLNQRNIPKRAISLMWNQRSVDTFLGLPFNISSYALLLMIIANEVNMVPDELIGNLGDTHLYLNHIDQAKKQIGRERTHEEMVEIYNNLAEKIDSKENLWTWGDRFEWNGITKRTREPLPLPTVKLNYYGGSIIDNIDNVNFSDFILENYQSHGVIKAPLSN